jgi:hypothetical protein
MAIVGQSSLRSLLLTNVAEIRFQRRVNVPGSTAFRRMWCTNSSTLLNSYNGRAILNYRPPSRGYTFDVTGKNLIVTWDILMQDYRNISMDNCDLLRSIPANEEFWKFFNENILIMSTQQKINFMNS